MGNDGSSPYSMQKYATRGHDDIGRNVPGSASLLQAIRHSRFIGRDGPARVHNGGMKAKRPAVSAEDQALFLAAVGDAALLNGRDRVAVPPPAPSASRVVELPGEVKLTI